VTDRRTVDTINDDQLSQLYDDLEHAEAELQQHAENESADAAAGSYAQRAERVEAQLTAVADLIADHEGDEWAAHPATAALRRILDGQAPAAAETEPNNAAATQATDVGTRIARAIHRYDNRHGLSGNDLPGKHHRGEADAVLAELRPELGRLDQTQPAAWTPPPPGDRREQLPDHILALLDIPSYTSTACEAAKLLERQMPHALRRVELGDHADRLHARCRLNHKFTGKPCVCRCHGSTEPPVHIGGGANAEDCPACTGTNPDYPFICPGPDAEQPARTTAKNPAGA
jgi:hypothetical protein